MLKHYRYKGRSWMLGRRHLIGVNSQQCDNTPLEKPFETQG